MVISVWVHRIDTTRFPSCAEGWRWCVGVGQDPADTRFWLNAGFGDTQLDAQLAGEQSAATAVGALRLAGVVDATRQTVLLELDPCPPESIDLEMPGSMTIEEL